MANHGLELLRRALARIGKIDFVIQLGFGEIGYIAPLGCKCVNSTNNCWIAIVRIGTHAPNAKALTNPQQLNR